MENPNLIIGSGQVGTALSNIFDDAKVVDIHHEKQGDPMLIHIAFPFDANFKPEVERYIKMYKASVKFVIIHSTVRVGTTNSIRTSFNDVHIIYSPMVGQHNALLESLKLFEKWFAGCCNLCNDVVEEHFKDKGLIPNRRDSANETEMAKLLSTTRYAINIAFAQEQERFCKKRGLNYSRVVTDFEKMFNMGTLEAGQAELMRPMIYPGVIGGHCLMPNVKILQSMFRSEFLTLIEESNERKRKASN